MNTISISQAKEIRESLGATHLVIFALAADGEQHVATHGATQQNAREAATAGNNLKAALKWPDQLCQAKPLPRKCENCVYWKPRDKEKDLGNGVVITFFDDGRGVCRLEPTHLEVMADNLCRHFEPNS